MSVHRETMGRKLLHVAGTGVHVEDAAAAMASKMVMVLVPSKLIAGRLARKLDELDLACLYQLLEVSIDGRQAKRRHISLSIDQDL